MSNPFQSDPNSIGNPYVNPPNSYYGPPPKEAKSLGSWAWIIAAVIGGGLLASCCLCGGLVFFGMSLESGKIQASLVGNKVIEEHIGEIKSLSLDFTQSSEEPEDVWAYRVEGTKGKGLIVGETHEAADGSTRLISGELRMKDGRKFDLFPHDEAAHE